MSSSPTLLLFTTFSSPFLIFKTLYYLLYIRSIKEAQKKCEGHKTNQKPREFRMDQEQQVVCVLDASTYVGLWIVKGLLNKGYGVHAAIQKNEDKETAKRIKDMEKMDKGLKVFSVDVMDYHSILAALKGCSALFCCLDNADGYDNDIVVDLEVRGAINVVEACAQTETINKVVFSSSLTAAIWRANICSNEDIDETSWSDQDFCRKMKLWYALAKTVSERAAWALAMDRSLDMVSINAGLVVGPKITQQNPRITMSYLKGASQMFENGVLAVVDVDFLADVSIRALEDPSTWGRYFCFNRIVKTDEEAFVLAQSLSPLIPLTPRYECQGSEVYAERLRTKKLDKLVEGTAY